MKYYVVAGTRIQFDHWIREYRHKYNAAAAEYVYGPAAIRAVKNPEVIFIGTWIYRDDIGEIIEAVKAYTSEGSNNMSQLNSILEAWKNHQETGESFYNRGNGV